MEIKAHAKGARAFFPEARTVLDIGALGAALLASEIG
jgi:activator of 2-hydroxyglutaryl-CoA dehydratase